MTLAVIAAIAASTLAAGPRASAVSACGGAQGANPLPFFNGHNGQLPMLNGPTRAVARLTGPLAPNQSAQQFDVLGTDLGIMWDNGQGQILAAFGDTFGFVNNLACGFVGDWRSNVLLRSHDRDLSHGIVFDSAAVDAPGHATEIIPSQHIPGLEITTIPTAGVAVGNTQYIDFMSVRSWGKPGEWVTNYSALAMSTDNGQTWRVDPLTVRPNLPGGYDNFQMGAYLRDGDWLYEFGTPPGRSGDARLARMKPEAIRDIANYQYWNGADWVTGNPAAATPVMAGPVSELSVQWNAELGEFIALATDATNSIVMRTAKTPTGPWSEPKTLVSSKDVPELYGAFIHPWSSGRDLYYLATTWSDYNVMLLHTQL
ncbi:DUF4185 domain-containing protein [Skermania sp. ID1734]|nr:DUF4185 domain-containing protein [Skermania sp. ID1734]